MKKVGTQVTVTLQDTQIEWIKKACEIACENNGTDPRRLFSAALRKVIERGIAAYNADDRAYERRMTRRAAKAVR